MSLDESMLHSMLQVYFELLGSLCSTGVMVPAATKKSFRPGACDTFTNPQMPYVGEPLRMRVFTDGAGLFAGWHLRSAPFLQSDCAILDVSKTRSLRVCTGASSFASCLLVTLI